MSDEEVDSPVVVYDKEKRKVRTYCTLVTYPLKNKSIY